MPKNHFSVGRVRLSPEAGKAPAGVPAHVAAVYEQLVAPLLLAESQLAFPDPSWSTASRTELPPSAEALALARKRLAEFLGLQEARLRARSPEVFALGDEILRFTWALLAQLPAWSTAFDQTHVANAPGNTTQERAKAARAKLKDVRAMRAEECRKRLGPNPAETLVTLADGLRAAVCRWADNETTVTVEWSTPDTIGRWAKVFQVGRNKMAELLKTQEIRNKPLSPNRYMVAVTDLPAKHQAKYRPPTSERPGN
jgi:hypothetical protein